MEISRAESRALLRQMAREEVSDAAHIAYLARVHRDPEQAANAERVAWSHVRRALVLCAAMKEPA